MVPAATAAIAPTIDTLHRATRRRFIVSSSESFSDGCSLVTDARRYLPPSPGLEVGASGNATPPGPFSWLSHGTLAWNPTPGFEKSHTPVGKVACNAAHWSSVKDTP